MTWCVCIKHNQQHQNLTKLSEQVLGAPVEGTVRGSGHPNQIPVNTAFQTMKCQISQVLLLTD